MPPRARNLSDRATDMSDMNAASGNDAGEFVHYDGKPDSRSDPQDRSVRGSERDDPWRGMSWQPASLLPVPEPRDGVEFRWIRSSMLGNGDTVNVSGKFRQGWIPVKAEDFPELKVIPDIDTRFPENIEVGGLILCQISSRLMNERRAHQQRMSDGQMAAVDRNYMRENDPRMPLLRPERESRITFGRD